MTSSADFLAQLIFICRIQLLAFWQDVFAEDPANAAWTTSPQQREEAITSAVRDSLTKFDDSNDGKIQKEEFLAHLTGLTFPSFPQDPSDALVFDGVNAGVTAHGIQREDSYSTYLVNPGMSGAPAEGIVRTPSTTMC